jgi:uncharacterized protein (UPF0248 family)
MAGPEISESLQLFLQAFDHFIRIDFSCKQLDTEHPHEIADALLQHTHSLCKTVTTRTDASDSEIHAQLWPTVLTTCAADAVISCDAHQDRGTFLVGLQGDLDDEAVRETLRSWQTDVRITTLFIDYVPVPSLATLLVSRQDLGKLVVDSWTYPELLQNPITIFTPTSTDSAPITSSNGSTARAGNPAAVAAARRSPSPSTKKLTPASAILNRLKWDANFATKDFMVVYEDRHAGLMESPVDSWTTESTEETFIPMHRVRAVKKRSTGQVVWHREERIDLISGSG